MAALTHFAPSPRFVAGLQANLAYWLRQTTPLTDTTINRLEPDFPNLLRVIEMGLMMAETQINTGRLMVNCFFWVEGAGHIHLWQPLLTKLLANLPPNQPLLHFQLLKQLGQFQRLQHQPELALATFQKALHLTHDPLLIADVVSSQ